VKQTELIMGMPITILVEGTSVSKTDLEAAFDRFHEIDEAYSPYKITSEVSRINKGLEKAKWSSEMKHIISLCEQTTRETHGFFEAFYNGQFDPSGLVKGWAIQQVAHLLKSRDLSHFFIDAGGDIQVSRPANNNTPWRVGIRNPMNREEIIKVVGVTHEGVATSGTYIRGNHIYNPISKKPADAIASLTVIGPNIYEADRFATAAFAMGPSGITFIESLEGFEAYMVDNNRIATFTSGFERYSISS